MNEIRDLIIGIDIGKEYTQICYYDRKWEPASMRLRDVYATVQNMMITVWDWKQNILPGKKAAS